MTWTCECGGSFATWGGTARADHRQRGREDAAMGTFTGEVAAPDATCPTCGLDVGSYAIGTTHDGRTTWDRPARHDIGATGTKFWSGGLTHVEGGERCR